MRGKCDKNVANTLPRVIGNCGELKDNLLLHGICTVAFSQNLNYRRRKKNTFSKLFLRKPVFTVVLTLLLTFAVGFSCIGFSAYATAYEQRIMIEKDYTSIALPAPKRVLQYKTEDGAVMYYEDDTFAYDFDRIEAVAKNAPQYKRSSNSGFLGGALRGGALLLPTMKFKQIPTAGGVNPSPTLPNYIFGMGCLGLCRALPLHYQTLFAHYFAFTVVCGGEKSDLFSKSS